MHSYTLDVSGCGESWGFQSAGEIHAFERVLTLDKLTEFAVQEGVAYCYEGEAGIVDGLRNSLDAAFDGLQLLFAVHEKIVVLNMYNAF